MGISDTQSYLRTKSFPNSFPAVGTDSVQEIGDGIYLNVMKNKDTWVSMDTMEHNDTQRLDKHRPDYKTSEACSLETTAEVTAFLGTNSLKVYRFSIPFKLKQTNQKRKIEKNSSNKKMSRVQLAAH